MSEISTNIVLDGITLTLRSAYPEASIRDDTVEQKLNPPAFIVLLTTSGQQTRGIRRYRRSPRFDIIYFPEAGREECYAVGDNLCKVLDLIKLSTGDYVRGTDVDFEVADGVLHFFISYRHYVYTGENEDPMETLEIR